MLSRRDELFPLARQVVRDSGYQYSKGASHPSSAACPSDPCSGGRTMCISGANGTTLPAEELSHHGGLHSGKRPRSEVGEGSPTRMAKRLQESAGEVGTAAAEASSSSATARARSPLRSGAAEAGSRATRPMAPSEHHRTPIG
ncbi:hypothetical protein J437_LFUL007691 [Ladona fulva]|uniref:NAB co-repressor domain-containing protein n=1 Tax=Ladona fulva TaxID=123851 RepID=A0A8K0K5Z2_LADFU|nr:hypothetical protein J437_LFUL007691 [Ladona fulva]